MNDRHPNHPDNMDVRTGEIVDEDVTGQEILDPISIGALATLQRVEIDQQVATAKAYPRNVPKIKQELTSLVTMDEDTADDCIYALPRGQKHIKGPSARFADALISFWGNARSGAFITQVNREEKFVEAIGSFQDVERNVIRQRRVRRPIAGRDGRIYNADMINMTGNAACVIAERNAILNGIPKSLWSGAYEQAFSLVAGTTKTLAEKLGRVEKAFMLHGIPMETVLAKLERQDVSKILPDDIVTLRGILNALRDGTETVETIFGRGAGHMHDTVQNPLKDDPLPAKDGPEKVMDTVADSRLDNVRRADPISSGTISETIARNADKATQGAQAMAQERSETASDDGEKTDMAPGASGKANQVGSTESGTQHRQTEKNERAASQTKPTASKASTKPYDDADGYMAFMRDRFDAATVKGALTELWGSTRSDRNEMLSPEQIEELTKDKDAKLAAFKLKEPK